MKISKCDKTIEEVIRINHAGEYAAKHIYKGQLAFIKDRKAKEQIKAMAKSEEEHLSYFEEQIKLRRIRPTLLHPLVGKIAYLTGAVTALLGKEAAMLCTSAVEEVIVEHYDKQLSALRSEDEDLKEKIKKFRDDELEHKSAAEEYELEASPMHRILSKSIRGGCRIAIKLVKYI